MRFVADEGDTAGKPLLAQGLDGAQPAQPSTDNHHLLHAALLFRAHGLSGARLRVCRTCFALMVSPRAAYVGRSTVPGALPQSSRPTPRKAPGRPARSGGIDPGLGSVGRLPWRGRRGGGALDPAPP